MKSKNVLVTLSILLFSVTVTVPIAYAVDVFQKDEMPFGKPYEDWVQDWWRWNAAIPGDPETTFAGVKENGCLINKEGPVAMLMDPAIGGSHHQKCEISSNQLLYLTVYAGECSTGSKPHEGEFPDTKNPDDLLACAKDSNLVMKLMQVKVDGKDVSSNIVLDY